MIRPCAPEDFEAVREIINDAARAYRGVIPDDRWKEPYMPGEELRREIGQGVVFWGWEEDGRLAGVMGLQQVLDVTLIRHAYVRTVAQKKGVGAALLSFLRSQTERPLLVGTWADARWAVQFYQKHGFRLVSAREKESLLQEYWSIPYRQVETSVVLADPRWFAARRSD